MRVITVAIVLAALAPLVAHAGVRVSRDGCGPLTVVAENALLSEVLAAMATQVAFKPRVTPGSDERISFTRTGTVDEVVTALARHRNVMLVRRTDERCGDRVPTTFWVLDSDANGQAGERVATSSDVGLPITLPLVPPPPGLVEAPERGPVAADSPRRFEATSDQTPEQRAVVREARRAERARRGR